MRNAHAETWIHALKTWRPCPRKRRGVDHTGRHAAWTITKKVSTDLKTEDGPPKKKMSLLLQMCSDSDSDEEVQPGRDIHRYRAEPCISMEDCPLQWWSAHSGAHDKLALLARKYLATPASTVPCERLFSVAGHIVQKKRSALLSENVNQLVCLSNWLKEE